MWPMLLNTRLHKPATQFSNAPNYQLKVSSYAEEHVLTSTLKFQI